MLRPGSTTQLDGIGLPLSTEGQRHEMARLSAPQRRAALVEAAIEVIAESGIAGATTRAVTDRAGMPLASFHYVFVSREALFEACLDQVISWEAEVFAAFEFTDGDIVARTHQVLHHLATMIREQPGIQLSLYHLLFHAQRRPEMAWVVDQYQTRTRELIGAMVTDAFASTPGRLSPSQLDRVVSLAVAVTAGMTTGYLRDRDAAELDRIVEVTALSIGTLTERMLVADQV